MSLVRSLIGNQFRDNPQSFNETMADYFGARTGLPINQEGNVTPSTTTISTDSSGATTVTQKQKIEPGEAPVAVQPVQQYQAPEMPRELIDLTRGEQAEMPGPQVPMAPVAPQRPQIDPRQQAAIQQQQQQQQILQAAAKTPIAQGQQSPETFQRMLQVESGGRQFNPDGSIVTSPKGAVGIAQVMPQTAANPGYGIKPATPQELATPEGNQKFGQRYFEGMFQKFGNDPEKAAAAYNAGPGTIEKAMLQSQQLGGDWKDYLPAETKDYITKVFPKGKEETLQRFQPLIAGVPTSDIGMTPTEQAVHHLALNSKDVNALGQGTYAGPHLIDPATKRAYADEHAATLHRNDMEGKAEKRAADIIANGGVGLQRALKDPSEEGSYLKAYLFKRLGLTDLAKNEQQKLGAGDMWAQTMVDGTPAWVKFNGQGAPVKGYTAEGELTPDQLINTTGSLAKAETESGLYFNPLQPESEKYFIRKINGRSEFVNASTQRVETRPEILNKLTKMSTAGSLPMQAEAAYQKRGQGARGAQAAETGQPQITLPTSGIPQVGGATTPPATVQGQVQTNLQGGQGYGPIAPPPGTVLPAPQAQGQQYPGQPQGQAPGVAPVAPQPQGGPVPYNVQKQQLAVGTEEQKHFLKYEADDIVPKADAGGQVSRIRRDQINGPDGILNNPEIAGILQGQGPASTEVANILRDMVTGDRSPADLSARVRSLDLTQRQKDVLNYQIGLQTQLAPLTLRANAGPGAISQGEHDLNRQAGIDITRQPLYSGLTLMTRSQFINDQASARAAFRAQHPELNTTTKFNSAWNAEKARQDEMYNKIYAARAAYIAKYNPKGQNPGAIVDAYKHYPVPDWNAQTGTWDVKGYSQKALRPSLSEFKE